MLRRLYDWCIAVAQSRQAPWALGTVSFAESSFFPIPPDVMLIPMALARPERSFLYATIATAASVAGGVFGYLIGLLLFDTVGQWLISLYGYAGRMEQFRQLYDDWGAWIVLIGGVSPFPYKVITIASGFVAYSLPLFIIFSVIARGARFYAVAFIIHRYGPWARTIIEERLTLLFWIFTALLVGGFAVAWYLAQ